MEGHALLEPEPSLAARTTRSASGTMMGSGAVPRAVHRVTLSAVFAIANAGASPCDFSFLAPRQGGERGFAQGLGEDVVKPYPEAG